MAAQHGLQILMDDETRPDQPAVAEHQREQPDDPGFAGLIGEDHLELGEVDLRLLAWRGLKAHLERRYRRRPHLAQKIGHRGVAARNSRARGSRAAAGLRSGPDRRRPAAADSRRMAPAARSAAGAAHRPAVPGRARCIFAPSCDRVPSGARSPRRSALAGADQDHDKLPKLDHRLPLPPIGRDHRTARRPASRGAPREAGHHTWGIFKRRFWGESLRHQQHSRLEVARFVDECVGDRAVQRNTSPGSTFS